MNTCAFQIYVDLLGILLIKAKYGVTSHLQELQAEEIWSMKADKTNSS